MMTLVEQERWVQKAIARRNRALMAENRPGSTQYVLIQGDIDALSAVLKTVQRHIRFQEAINTVRQMPASVQFL